MNKARTLAVVGVAVGLAMACLLALLAAGVPRWRGIFGYGPRGSRLMSDKEMHEWVVGHNLVVAEEQEWMMGMLTEEELAWRKAGFGHVPYVRGSAWCDGTRLWYLVGATEDMRRFAATVVVIGPDSSRESAHVPRLELRDGSNHCVSESVSKESTAIPTDVAGSYRLAYGVQVGPLAALARTTWSNLPGDMVPKELLVVIAPGEKEVRVSIDEIRSHVPLIVVPQR